MRRRVARIENRNMIIDNSTGFPYQRKKRVRTKTNEHCCWNIGLDDTFCGLYRSKGIETAWIYVGG